MMHDRQVTIVLAAYKGGEYAGAQIESILAQDLDDWFLVLSDDGEDTQEVLDFYAEKYPDRIWHYRSGQRFGSSRRHFMHLISRFGQEAPYLMCCDQDDVWHPDKVRVTLEAMKKAEEACGAEKPVLVHTDLRVVDGELNEICPSFMQFSKIDGSRLDFHELLVQNAVTGCTMMVNRTLANLAAPAEKDERIVMHDWWLALIASAFGKVVFVPQATIDYRQHGSNVVGAKNAGSLKYMAGRLFGSYAVDIRDASIAQTEAFLYHFSNRITPEQRRLCHMFMGLKSHGKAWRIRTMARYDLWKNTLPRRVGQVIRW